MSQRSMSGNKKDKSYKFVSIRLVATEQTNVESVIYFSSFVVGLDQKIDQK
jgi:hypothetical protein